MSVKQDIEVIEFATTELKKILNELPESAYCGIDSMSVIDDKAIVKATFVIQRPIHQKS